MLLTLSLLAAGGAPVDSGSRITEENGAWTLTLNEQPFLVLGAQCDIWRSTRQDEATLEFLDGYRDMNATAVGLGIPWSRVEPEKDVYDFAFIDWFTREAESRGLKVVLHLFSTNVCGKIYEAYQGGIYPQYAPTYMIEAPETYQRMDLGDEGQYAYGGPPMCPNDPDTLAREAKYVRAVAEHLRDADADRTVIMVQLNNEFYYQQWIEAPGDPAKVRCRCEYCEAKYDGEPEARFMFASLAEYAAGVSRAFSDVYDIPLYVNSPWWPTWVIELFLERCPEIDLVGIDGVFTPREPNQLSQGQLGRNIPFASECPTENAETRRNLGVLPYYVLLRRQGIGNLLWDAGPDTMVRNEETRARYGAALYPLKHAMAPIARARGTERMVGWFALEHREAPGAERDVFGNETGRALQPESVADKLYLRKGDVEREIDGSVFTCQLAGSQITVSDSVAGVIVDLPGHGIVVATSGGTLAIKGAENLVAEVGRFEGDVWISEGELRVEEAGDTSFIEAREPVVILLER